MCTATIVVASTREQAARFENAAQVLREVRSVPDREIPQDLWDRAACVAVFPGVKKAAFVVGGEYGKGVLSCRARNGWSAPVFLQLEKGSVGVQIGAESIDVVLLVMNDRGVDRLMQDRVTLGGELSVAAGPVGRDARAATDATLTAEMLSYSRAHGLFAGINLTGGVIRPDGSNNRELYGRPVTAREVLRELKLPAPSAARPFVTALGLMSRPERATTGKKS